MALKTMAVIGASKGIGLSTLLVALERGWKVNALAHKTEISINNEHLKITNGSILDPSKVREVVQSAQVVVITVGHSISFRKVTLFSEGTKVVIDTLLGWNPSAYVIVVTGIGAGESAGHGGFFYDKIIKPIFLRRIFQDKNRQEILIRSSNLDWTIVRPGFLTDGPLTSVYRILEKLDDIKAGKISRHNCGDFIVREAESKFWKRKAVLIG
ncbi:MAG: NAD(P)H-binding protein [Leptospira sp.]|nr:NAD(P)H-binding protein [Leptospira sp.]